MLKDLLQLKALKGKRTLIVAAVMAVLTFLKLGEIISVDQYTTVLGLLTAAGVVAAADHDK